MPDPNRYAGPAEAALLREHITTEEGEMERVQARLKAVSTMLHDAEQRLQAAQEEASAAREIMAQVKVREALVTYNLLYARGLLHPVRRLPDDVLAAIFQAWAAAVQADMESNWKRYAVQQVPFLAASVCRRWRLVALETPALWTDVTVYLNDEDVLPAAWLTYVQCIQQRSKNAPLAVDIRIPKAERPEDVRLISELIAISDRWLTVTIQTNSIRHQGFQRFLRSSTLSMLECIEITARHGEDHFALFEDAPRLRTLSLLHAPVAWTLCNTMTSVHALTIDNITLVEARDLAVVASKLPNLEKLSISCTGIPGDQTTPIVTFPRVLSLKISNPIDQPVAQSLRFPQLQELDLKCFFGGHPGLESIVVFLQASACHSTLRRLTVGFIKIGGQFVGALRLLTQLEELTLHNCNVRDSFFRAMSAADATGAWIAPRLWRVHARKVPPVPRAGVSCDELALQELVRVRQLASSGSTFPQACALRDVVREGF